MHARKAPYKEVSGYYRIDYGKAHTGSTVMTEEDAIGEDIEDYESEDE